jgi:hypothetical protein
MSCKYVYDQIIKRVHPDWLDFFNANRKELETKNIQPIKWLKQTE